MSQYEGNYVKENKPPLKGWFQGGVTGEKWRGVDVAMPVRELFLFTKIVSSVIWS
jgi:hypothetical protein